MKEISSEFEWEGEIPLLVVYSLSPEIPEYIPPYSKPEEYDPGTDAEITELECFLFRFVGEKQETLNITKWLPLPIIQEIEKDIIEAYLWGHPL